MEVPGSKEKGLMTTTTPTQKCEAKDCKMLAMGFVQVADSKVMYLCKTHCQTSFKRFTDEGEQGKYYSMRKLR